MIEAILKWFGNVVALFSHPITQLVIASAIISGFVSSFKGISKQHELLQKWLDWGKGQWMQAFVLLGIAYYAKLIPDIGGPMVTIGAGTLLSVGIFSIAKNSGQSSVMGWFGDIIGKLINKVIKKKLEEDEIE